ncbi:MAG: DUF1517 domain-containing protein [Cyanobacteriota bacterium]|nr:DUF1517 domain-containing protein [Cyanobacteriota bacterium]
MGFRLLKRVTSLMVVPILLTNILFLAPSAVDAASGGRIGGGSFRSAPSPRSYGGGGGRVRGSSGGMGGGYVPVPYGGGFGGGYYGGGGFGLPFIMPIFGFGGGLLGFLVLMAVLGLFANALRGVGSGALAGVPSSEDGARSQGPVTLAQVQVGLLPSAKELQADLRRLASTADTSSPAGLRRVLQETSLSLLRNPDLWVYANVESAQVSFNAAEDTFNRLAIQERSKLSKEILTNVAGRRDQVALAPAPEGPESAINDYIAVTVLVAARNRLRLKEANSAEALREALQQLGAISDLDLIALEVIWQPEGVGEVLSTEELLTAYPQLQHL